ncbi:Dot/Icm secretion system substrate [Legionella wadsworthii]|uniref:Dot/Icm secretion system substrate n=1 Tax=Legionella wadsworthii TaxID=28088 RepID=A0A378LUL4_9GAMM|nr:hypothetical protein [Legionella wadsworthii]STY30956.1 Dot/Icm secretion system substrate [Legionella wadsworthii]
MGDKAPSLISNKDVTLPPREDLLKAMQNAERSPEAARYLSERVHQIVDSSKFINKSPASRKVAEEVLKAVDEFTKFVEYKFEQGVKPWSGEMPEKSDFKRMQQGIAQEAVGTISQKQLPGIRFDFAISREGHFVRGYASTDNQAGPLGEDTVASLDRLFNAWLASKNPPIATDNGYFYRADANGNRDNKALTAEEVEELMQDSAEDFKRYLADRNVETSLVSKHRDYPGEEHRVKKAAAQKAVERAIEIGEEKAPEPTPQQSQSTAPR